MLLTDQKRNSIVKSHEANNPRTLLLESFQAALAVADPLKIVGDHLPPVPKAKTLVVGAGKAAAAMALAVEQHWPKQASLEGLVITRYGHGMPTQRIKVIEAGHPVPDDAGKNAAQEIMQRVQRLSSDDLLLVLISGGGSSLLSLPVPEITMENLKEITRHLLASGTPIQEINTVRKHLSIIQGGKLAALSPARVLALIISDVTGDDPTHIASGPCAPDPTTYADALAILERYQITPPAAIKNHLERGSRGEIDETPKSNNPLFKRVENRVIATAHKSLEAAAEYFRSKNINPIILGDTVTGEATEVARVYGALVREIKKYQQPVTPPVALISGGECTVTVRGKGRGGRCSEFLLSLTLELDGIENVFALACDTDGIDGSEDNAGAIMGPDSIQRAKALGLNPKKILANNDAYGLFHALNDLVVTGPTRTNVNDYRAILVL